MIGFKSSHAPILDAAAAIARGERQKAAAAIKKSEELEAESKVRFLLELGRTFLRTKIVSFVKQTSDSD